MGIAAGGQIKQQIYPDIFGAESWDSNRRKTLTIHMVNSVAYKAITGNEPPPSPITIEQYQKFGIPWFSHYDESIPKVATPSIFKRILSVGAIEKRRGISSPPQPLFHVSPEHIQRIKTPDVGDLVAMLRRQASSKMVMGEWKMALSDISRLIDLNHDLRSSDFAVRSSCNYHLNFYRDGYIDGCLGIERNAECFESLSWRAKCRLGLGDYEGLKADADQLIRIPQTQLLGLELHAEATFHSGDFNEAIYDALALIGKDPKNLRAEQILSQARSKAYDKAAEERKP